MRLIDGEALSKGLQDVLKERADEKGTAAYQIFELFIEYLAEKPTIDAVPMQKAHWIKKGNEKTCSGCGFIYYSNNDDWNYCPNCGAGRE